MSRSRPVILAILSVATLLVACGPDSSDRNAQSTDDGQCFDMSQPGILETLASEIGSHICLSGSLEAGTHSVSFRTTPLVERESVDIYGDQVYVLIDIRDVWNMGLSNGDYVELTGTLELNEVMECTPERCRALNLRLD